ncbi:MAG: glycosyltransferase [Candidatus Geothermincolales bacterium]
MKIALVHDWLTNLAGSERVLLALHELYPEAPIYTSVFVPEEFPQLKGAEVRTSFLQKIPLARKRHQLFPYLRTVAFERFDLSGFDVVISSCHAEAKGVLTRPETLHICYCYTPIRYYWSGYHHYLDNPRFGPLNPLARALMPFMINYLRVWDRCAADRVDVFVAISRHVADRIRKYYRREAEVIYPPVNASLFRVSERVDDYFLLVGRLIPYKRADLVVEAFNRLGLPLKVVGTGSELESLRSLARPNVEFLGRVGDAELAELYSRCLALIFPQEEDFGIVPLEAMASGRPVIAYRAGGATETVVEGKTGVFFDRQEVETLVETVRTFRPEDFDPETIRKHALAFDLPVFQERIRRFVERTYAEFKDRGDATRRGYLVRLSGDETEGQHGEGAHEKRARA